MKRTKPADSILGFTIVLLTLVSLYWLCSSCVTVKVTEDPAVSNCRSHCEPDRFYYNVLADPTCTCYTLGPNKGKN